MLNTNISTTQIGSRSSEAFSFFRRNHCLRRITALHLYVATRLLAAQPIVQWPRAALRCAFSATERTAVYRLVYSVRWRLHSWRRERPSSFRTLGSRRLTSGSRKIAAWPFKRLFVCRFTAAANKLARYSTCTDNATRQISNIKWHRWKITLSHACSDNLLWYCRN